MSTTALLLVLAAAALHATWNYQLKKAAAGKLFWPMSYAITLIVCIPVLLLYDPHMFEGITATGWLVISLSAPIHITYAYTLQYSYSKSDYSIVYPTARGTGPLITVLAAVFLIGNNPSVLGWCGIVSILAGIVFLTLQGGSKADSHRIYQGLFWGTVTGCLIAGYSFCDAWAVQQATGLTPLSFYFPALAIRCLILWPLMFMRPHWKEEMKTIWNNPIQRKALLCTTVGSPGAYILVLFALLSAPLAYVAPSREVGMMVGVIIGAILLKERLSLTRVLGIAAMVAGVVLIGLAK